MDYGLIIMEVLDYVLLVVGQIVSEDIYLIELGISKLISGLRM